MLDHIESHIHNTFQILTICVQNFYILILASRESIVWLNPFMTDIWYMTEAVII